MKPGSIIIWVLLVSIFFNGALLTIMVNDTYSQVEELDTDIEEDMELQTNKIIRAIVASTDGCDDFLQYMQHGDRYVLYDMVNNKSIIKQTKLLGVYSPRNDITCMFYEDMNETDVMNHEYCHYLIDEADCSNKGINVTCAQHFCEDKEW